MAKRKTLAIITSDDPVQVHYLQVTMLHLLGLDHERLVYFYQGRISRVSDVYGELSNQSWRDRPDRISFNIIVLVN